MLAFRTPLRALLLHLGGEAPVVAHGRFSSGDMQLSGWQRFAPLMILLSSMNFCRIRFAGDLSPH